MEGNRFFSGLFIKSKRKSKRDTLATNSQKRANVNGSPYPQPFHIRFHNSLYINLFSLCFDFVALKIN